MKKLFFLLAICGTSLMMTSCGEDETPLVDFMTATIDGNAFEAAAVSVNVDTTIVGEILFISGTDAAATYTVSVNIPTANLPIGTPIAIDAIDFGLMLTDADGNPFVTVGEVTIDTNDTEGNVIEGTFSFTATFDNPVLEHTITGGEFRATY